MVDFEKNNGKRKGQSAIEFVIFVGVVLAFLVGFLYIVQSNISDRIQREKDIAVQEIALQVQDEINLAFESVDGYYRKFEIPAKVVNIDYEITINEGVVYVKTVDEKHAITLPVAEVEGEVFIGENIIRKEDGVIYLNLFYN